MWKLRKTGYFVGSEGAIAANSLSVEGGDLLTRNANGFIEKANDGADVILGVATGEATYASDNETVAKAVIDFPVKNEEMRVELSTTADITQAMVGDSFDIDATQAVVNTVAGDQVQLVEILDTRVGSFKIL